MTIIQPTLSFQFLPALLPPIDSYHNHLYQESNPTRVGGIFFIAVSQALSTFPGLFFVRKSGDIEFKGKIWWS